VGTAPVQHPSEQALNAFGLGKLDDRAAAAVSAHLKSCDTCRDHFAELSDDSFLAHARKVYAREQSSGPAPQAVASSSSRPPAASAPPPPASTMPPELAENPDYEIKKELGRGGMGVVFLAHNKLMGRDEVLKVMSRQIIEKSGVFDRFQREIRAVAKLQHPNIVTAYSAARLGESFVFSMEYVDGFDLSKLVKANGPLPVAMACVFVQQTARGIQHAHERGLVHRDIKPANLMLAKSAGKPIIKILDFGLAKLTSEKRVEGGLTAAGQALGTPDYIAPEQILDAQSADIRADIYSLGATLYYLLNGSPPFKANSLYEIYQAHISREPEPLNLVRPEVPLELAAVVAKMMAKQPERRFQTPDQVAQALAPFTKTVGAAASLVPNQISVSGEMPAGSPEHAIRSESSRRGSLISTTGTAQTKGHLSQKEPPAAPLLEPSALDLRTAAAAPGKAVAAPRWPRWLIAAAAGAGLAALLLGIIVFIRSNQDGSKTETIVAIGTPEDLNKAGITPGPKQEPLAANPGRDSPARETTKPAGARTTAAVNQSERKASDRAKAPVGSTTGAGGAGRSLTVASAEPPSLDSEWVTLFNGKDLTGWKTHPSQPGRWTVNDGILVGSGPEVSHLYTERGDYKGFHLKIEARYREGGSGAILFRSGFGPERPDVAPQFPRGFHATINSTRNFRGNTGGIFTGGTRGVEWIVSDKGTPVQPGEWFVLEILASEVMLNVYVNGVRSGYLRAGNDENPAGHIALEHLSPNPAIEFRSIQIREFDVRKPGAHQIASLTGHGRRVACAVLSPDSRRVITGGDGFMREGWGRGQWNWPGPGDNTVRFWDVQSGKELKLFPGHNPGVAKIAFSRDGTLAASCGGWNEYQHLDVYDVATGRRIHEIDPDIASAPAAAKTVILSDDNRQLRVGYPGGFVRTWDLESAKEKPRIMLKAGMPGPNEFPFLLFTSDQERLITGGQGGAVELWTLKNGTRLKAFSGHASGVTGLACSADASLILSSGSDDFARLWEVDSGKQCLELDCREDGLTAIALSPDGRRALTGGRYGTIHIWDLGDGREIGRLEGHTMRINCLGFSADGQLAVSGSDDRTARVWKLPGAPGR
jgi:serine/threonine protein kinase/WD40 repeat protein